MPPGFFYFTQTNYVRSFAACCNRRCSLRASWLWSDRIKTSQKKRFLLWRWSWSVPTEIVACSRRSYSGVRREGRERERNKKEGKREREKGTPTSLVLSPTPPRRCLFFFFLLTSLCAVPTIWTPGTGYEIVARKGCLVFIVFLSITTSFQNISITLLQISLKPHNIRIRRHSNIKTWPSLYCIFIFLTCYMSVVIVILNLC